VIFPWLATAGEVDVEPSTTVAEPEPPGAPTVDVAAGEPSAPAVVCDPLEPHAVIPTASAALIRTMARDRTARAYLLKARHKRAG
jgi:hypothetical protein